MEEKSKKENVQSRREFFKEAAKKTLPILGTLLLAGAPILSQASNADSMGCNDSCYSRCGNSCYTSCSGSCDSICARACASGCESGCRNSCYGGCSNTCHGSCSGGCARSAYA